MSEATNHRGLLLIVTGNFATNIAITGLTALSSVLMSRKLGPEGRGSFLYVYNLISIAAGLGMVGIPEFIGISIVRSGRMRVSYSVLLVASFLSLMAAMAACFWFGIPIKTDAYEMIFCIAWPLTMSCANICIAILQARGAWQKFNYVRLSFTVFFFVAISAGSIIEYQSSSEAVHYMLISAIVANFAAGGVALKLTHAEEVDLRNAEKPLSVFSFWSARSIFVQSVMLQTLGFLSSQFDVALISISATPAELGYFSVAKTIANTAIPFATALSIVSFRYEMLFGLNGGIVSIGIWLVLSSLTWLGSFWIPDAIRIVYGGDFLPAVAIFDLYWPAAIAIAASAIVEEALRGRNLQFPLISVRVAYVAFVAGAYFIIKPPLSGVVKIIVVAEYLKYFGVLLSFFVCKPTKRPIDIDTASRVD